MGFSDHVLRLRLSFLKVQSKIVQKTEFHTSHPLSIHVTKYCRPQRLCLFFFLLFVYFRKDKQAECWSACELHRLSQCTLNCGPCMLFHGWVIWDLKRKSARTNALSDSSAQYSSVPVELHVRESSFSWCIGCSPPSPHILKFVAVYACLKAFLDPCQC